MRSRQAYPLVLSLFVVCFGCSPREPAAGSGRAEKLEAPETPLPTSRPADVGELSPTPLSPTPLSPTPGAAASTPPAVSLGKVSPGKVSPGDASVPAAQKSQPGKTDRKSVAELSAGCQTLDGQLTALRKRIPFLFVDLKRSFSEIDVDIQEAIRLAEKFLADCGEKAGRSDC